MLVGAGSVCLGYSGQALFLPNWFVRRRGLAMSIAFAGVGVGSITLLPWVQTLIEQSGWRAACSAMGMLALVVLAPINLLLRRGPRTSACSRTATPRPATPAAQPRRTWSTRPGRQWTGRFVARCAPRGSGGSRSAYFCGLYAWYAVQVHQTKYLVEIGFSATVAAWALGSSASPAFPARSRSAISPTGSGANGSGPSAASASRSAMWR